MSLLRRLIRNIMDRLAQIKSNRDTGTAHLKLGRLGEDLAVNALKERGYRIAERNAKIEKHEVDVIAVDGETLVFIEVKTRSSHEYGPPMSAITPKRIARFKKAATLYTMKKKIKNVSIRFDVVTVDFADGKREVEVVKNAF